MGTLKSKGLKAGLVKQAEDNARVTVGTRKEQEVVKAGIPNEHSRKHLDGELPCVGLSLGVTLNMENYQSARIDVWATDSVKDGETFEGAYSRVYGVVNDTLQDIASQYK